MKPRPALDALNTAPPGEFAAALASVFEHSPWIAEAAASMEDLYAKSDALQWIGSPGYPTRVIFAMITCSPFTWRLVVPYPGNPSGLVLLQTGKTMPIVW